MPAVLAAASPASSAAPSSYVVPLPASSAAVTTVSSVRPSTVEGGGRARLWLPPLGVPLRIAAVHSLPNGPYRAGHRGIDLRAAPDDPVRSPAAGRVSFTGTVAGRPVVSIRVDERTVLSLEPVAGAIRTGALVEAGAVVGAVSRGGHCGSSCLHLGVRVDGAYVDPMRFLRPKPVLLPW